MNFSNCRMTNYEWAASYREFLGKAEFYKFLDRVYQRLLRMHPGEVYDIATKVQEKNRDLFIKCACLFIQEGHAEYEFDDCYTRLRRVREKELFTSPTMKRIRCKK